MQQSSAVSGKFFLYLKNIGFFQCSLEYDYIRDHGINGIRDIHKLCVNLDVPVLHVLGQVIVMVMLMLIVIVMVMDFSSTDNTTDPESK